MLFTCGLFPCSSGESCDFFKNDRIHLPSRRCPIPNLWHFYLRPRQYCNLPAVCFEISFEPSVMKLDDLSCQIETSWWWTIPSFIILVCQMCLFEVLPLTSASLICLLINRHFCCQVLRPPLSSLKALIVLLSEEIEYIAKYCLLSGQDQTRPDQYIHIIRKEEKVAQPRP